MIGWIPVPGAKALAPLASLALLMSLLASGCENPVAWRVSSLSRKDSLINYYRTPHFVFFFDTSVYSMPEVISNGKAKEAHLQRINKELGVSFEKEIMVRLISESGQNWSGQAYPREPYFIQETRDYFVEDNGHEVVHIVSFETLGLPWLRFFVEGLAAAHELDARPKYARLCGIRADPEELPGILERMIGATISENVNYELAAAYVEWLEVEFGLETFKSFYQELAGNPNYDWTKICIHHFGIHPEQLHERFSSERFTMARNSRYCAGN